MKNLAKIMMVVAALLVLGVGQVWAYSFNDIDNQSVTLNINFDQSGGYGVQVSSTNDILFYTFCLEADVNFYYTNSTHPNSLPYLATVDELVLTGASSASIFERGGLHAGTKYLYWNFVHNQSAFDSLGWSNNEDGITAMQKAIWALQQTKYQHGFTEELEGIALGLFDMANSATNIGESLNVMVMNLWKTDGSDSQPGYARQSQLIAGPAPVPEPGTLLLLGSGLAGLSLYRRRTRK